MSPDGNTPSEHPHAQPAHDPTAFALPEPARLSPARAVAIVVLAIVVLGGAFLVAWLPRRKAQQELASTTKTAQHAAMRVTVAAPKELSSDRAIVLPGTIKPLQETVIYSRANGYLKKWYVDIGDKVKDGQLLAEIDTPELDQQIMQARAQLAQAEAQVTQAMANRDFSKSNLERYKKLTPQGVTSQQELDQHAAQAQVDEANVTVAQANVGAQHANIDRLNQLKSFARVMAPFGGTISARSVDIGALVTAGNGTPLFNLVDTDPVRVFIQVPQDVAPGVRADVAAEVSVREYASRVFSGKVARAAGSLDQQSRTMLTEVRVPNPDGALLAGMYAEVALTLPNPHRVFEIPASAVVTDAKGLRVQVVAGDGKVHFVPIVEERDTGSTVLVSSGLSGTERVIKLPNAGLVEGSDVEVVE